MASGLYSKEEVGAKVSAQGLTTRRGKRIGPQQFDRLLRNEFYAGFVSAPSWDLRAKGRHIPLVDSELFRSVQVVLAGRRPNVSAISRDRVEFPLRRFVDCGRCGTPLTASSNERNIRDQRLSELRRKGDKASDLLVDGVITTEVYKRQIAKLDEEMLAVPLADRTVDMAGFSVDKLFSPAAAILFNLADSWVKADLKAKHRIQATIFPGKVVYLDGRLETRRTSLLFNELRRFSSSAEQVASPTGFEPVLPP